MSKFVRSQWEKPVPSFGIPLTPPESLPNASPLHCAQWSAEYTKYILGALEQLALASTWKGDDTVKNNARDKMFNLIEQIGVGVDCPTEEPDKHFVSYDFTTSDFNCVIGPGGGSYQSGVGFKPSAVQSGFSWDFTLELFIPVLGACVTTVIHLSCAAFDGLSHPCTTTIEIDLVSGTASATTHADNQGQGGTNDYSLNIEHNDLSLGGTIVTISWRGYPLQSSDPFTLVSADVTGRF